MGKLWENHRKTMGKPWENYGKIWGNYGKIGKIIGKIWENDDTPLCQQLHGLLENGP